jgi:hypothetical protein
VAGLVVATSPDALDAVPPVLAGGAVGGTESSADRAVGLNEESGGSPWTAPAHAAIARRLPSRKSERIR